MIHLLSDVYFHGLVHRWPQKIHCWPKTAQTEMNHELFFSIERHPLLARIPYIDCLAPSRSIVSISPLAVSHQA
jgi:hypothetical protein